MSRIGKFLRVFPLLFLFLPGGLVGQRGGGGGGAEAGFFRGVAEYYNVAHEEVSVLSEWGLAPAEIPVVLFLAGRVGISPDVVVARRQRGADWIDIARGLGVHAGDLYVRLEGPSGFLSGAYDRFNSSGPAEWDSVTLTDREVTGLVNVRFISRFLEVPPGDVIRALQTGGSVVQGYTALRRRTQRP
ncbi:MAG: hypothetical protein ACR2QM_00975 [Longimicrobiales bacterium]